jgi:hypothetical protein
LRLFEFLYRRWTRSLRRSGDCHRRRASAYMIRFLERYCAYGGCEDLS